MENVDESLLHLREEVLHPTSLSEEAKNRVDDEVHMFVKSELARPEQAVVLYNMMNADERAETSRTLDHFQTEFDDHEAGELEPSKEELLARIDRWRHSGHHPTAHEIARLKHDIYEYRLDYNYNTDVKKYIAQFKHLLVNRRPTGSDDHRVYGSGKGGKKSMAFKRKVAKVMREFHAGILKSSSGRRVTSEKQALAIALSEARRYAS